ncbi:LacI family DNA-binding transcriptional regulator [Domibacillus sp. A3M-37]|uniref:LacI family DNA-binding transcriptional regulator n=1 Tax=Domibacillus sp. A3M-37 TaxID=2962037 RepID=UPI0020B74CB6|nr:LacI family DNA-binding transcriptional regulator [Domibacillus sp. A3M-37]MCP3764931.1 LacI family DNA-binding transcriptional regulator [Domibacillus sp. A3M-37]
MKPKIKDVAKLAGVSPTTVSRVLNNRGYLSQEVREKVAKAMKELNYIPNDLARSLFTQRTNLIGFIFPTTANPFYGELIFHMENLCFERGYRVLLCNSSSQPEKEEQYVEMLLRNQVDGIISGAHNLGIKAYQHSLPIVAIDRYLSETIPVVSSDNYQGGRLATELLIWKKCKRIIHINGTREMASPANKRRDAYEDVMKENGREFITYEIPVMGPAEKIISQLFDEQLDVDGIFASDDHIASRIIAEARRRNIIVPEQLKVIGYDGTSFVRSIFPELTTIQQPIVSIAEKAVDLLIEEIEGTYEKDSEKEFVFPVQLIEGSST